MSTLHNAFKMYLLHERNYSHKTVSAYENDLNQFSNFIFANNQENDLSQINYNQIRSWIVSLVENNVQATTVNRKVSSLQAFYKFLVKSKQISVNPLTKHKSLKAGKKIQIPFSELEVKKVLTQSIFSNDFEGVRNKLIIDLLYTTGIRRTELIELKVSDVDLYNFTIKVLGKRNKERIIPLLPECVVQLKDYLNFRSDLQEIKQQNILFLTNAGIKLNISLVYRLVNKYFSGVTEKVKTSPHIVRHSFATHLLNGGADISAVRDLLGHASLASTQVYTHNSLSELKKAHVIAHPRQKK